MVNQLSKAGAFYSLYFLVLPVSLKMNVADIQCIPDANRFFAFYLQHKIQIVYSCCRFYIYSILTFLFIRKKRL